MPGQGYHFGFSRLVAEKAGKKFSNEILIGTLVVDALNSAAGARRNSHYTGGAGCILPEYTNLRQSSSIQSWDSGYQKSFLVDPQINMSLMETANLHIPEDDYKDGIRLHLLADAAYDRLVQNDIFNVCHQENNIIQVRSTGEELDGATFRKELYASYPMLDQYLMQLAGITASDVEEAKCLLRSTLSDAHAEFICKYLNYNPDYVWEDTKFFNKEIIDKLIESAVSNALAYLNW